LEKIYLEKKEKNKMVKAFDEIIKDINDTDFSKRKSLVRQKTISGVKYQVRPRFYYGDVCGWDIYENGEKVYFLLVDPIFGPTPEKVLEMWINGSLKNEN